MSQLLEKKPVTCGFCDYKWNTSTQMYYATCPRCRHTVKLIDYRKVPQSDQATNSNQIARTALQSTTGGAAESSK